MPLQEALACGMPSVMPNAAPQNGWLPGDMLVFTRPDGELRTRISVEKNAVNPVDLAAHLDYLYNSPRLVETLSLMADEWATEHSWDALKPRYEAVLKGD